MQPGIATPNLVLTGFMGTGKSTVGRLVAERLGYDFADTDAVIEASHGPVPDIFASAGEAGFRRLEHAVATDLGQREGLVIATGGGTLLDPANVDVLSRRGVIICLTASLEEIVTRVHTAGGPTRPLLAGPDPEARIRELLARRSDVYGRFVQVSTDGRDPDEVADEVVERWRAAVS